MLAGMSVNINHFNGASSSITNNENMRRSQARIDLMNGGRRTQSGMIPPEFAWIYRG